MRSANLARMKLHLMQEVIAAHVITQIDVKKIATKHVLLL